MWFILALSTAMIWGATECFAKKGTDPNDNYSHWRVAIAVGFVMGIHAIGTLIYHAVALDEVFNPMNIIYYLPVSMMYIISMILGYCGLRYLELSVISPVETLGEGALVPILCFFILKQTMSPLQAVCVGMIIVGVFALAIVEKRTDDKEFAEDEPKEKIEGRGKINKYKFGAVALLFPIGYSVIDGLGTFLDSYYLDGDVPIMSEFEANTSYELTFLIFGIGALIYLTCIKKQPYKLKNEGWFTVSAVCETVGQLTYIYALAANPIIAAPIISCDLIFELIYSRIFFKEKLTVGHYICIAVVVAAVIGLGVIEGLDA